MKSNKGFTLIELLVVIAVIGILAAVVLASLNSARVKGQEASIKSNLRNMIAAAELSYEATGNYSGACAAVQTMMDAIQKITTIAPKCFSYNSSGLSDVYLRWGVSATNAAKDKNWSVDGSGVVTWDTSDVAGGALTAWAAGMSTCATAGKKMPTLEQLKSLYDTHTATPTGFTSNSSYGYWSSVTVPTTPGNAHYVLSSSGSVGNSAKTNGGYIRCVQ